MKASREAGFVAAARSAVSLLLVAAVAVAASAACGNNTVTPCESSKCAPGNSCIALNGETRCRKACSSNTDPATSCPFGYTCKDPLNGTPPFCVESTATVNGLPLTAKAGQWGTSCHPNLGLQNNPDCDSSQGFQCYGHSPTDAEAYCTRYDCTKDDDCGPGFWCGQINQTPNVTSLRRQGFGQEQNVCLRREYCATCAADVDCPVVHGTKQHCIPDDSGKPFCAPECLSPGTCPTEAKCILGNLGSTMICYPRAKVCVGDGSLCAPCRVDTDCGTDGACLKGDYSTEHSCAKKTADCKSCPMTIATPARSVGCLPTATDTQPSNYCFGIYSIAGSPSDIGCYSPDR